MITMSVGEFKTHFSEVLEQVKAGEKIAVTFGKKKEIVGYFTPKSSEQPERKLGILEGKAKVIFAPDFKMTEEEFLNYGLPS
jgi:antitoxin (DNA-binding transcriptional repressor) of toxin-antitoxin stability system